MLKGCDLVGERQNNLLKAIVESYIKNVKPVGSKSLCDMFNCSSATIRNDMSYLEELGYLEKTHTSSGRIPSEKGYNYYVENLMKPKEITGEDFMKLQTILNNKDLVLTDAINKCMEIISDITNYTSIVLGKSSENNILKQISIIPISDKRVVTVLVTNTGHVENKQTIIPNDISVKEVVKTCELINKSLVGTPLNEVLEKLEFVIKPEIAKTIEKYEELCSFFYDAFSEFKEKSEDDIFFGGKTNILKQPEYNEPEKIKEIISKLEDNELVKNIETDDREIKVFIGSDNNFDPDTTVIRTSYNVDGVTGTLAIIGPKRMEYDKVVTLLNYLKNYIER